LGSYTRALLVSQDRRHLFGDPLFHTDSRDSTGRQILNFALQTPSAASLSDGASSTFGGAAPLLLCLMVTHLLPLYLRIQNLLQLYLTVQHLLHHCLTVNHLLHLLVHGACTSCISYLMV
jgi:hypothetical protein